MQYMAAKVLMLLHLDVSELKVAANKEKSFFFIAGIARLFLLKLRLLQ